MFPDWKTQYNKDDNYSQIDATPIKIPARFLRQPKKVYIKFTWKGTGLRIAKIILTKQNKVREISLSYIKVYCITIVIKTVQYWWRFRYQINGTE